MLRTWQAYGPDPPPGKAACRIPSWSNGQLIGAIGPSGGISAGRKNAKPPTYGEENVAQRGRGWKQVIGPLAARCCPDPSQPNRAGANPGQAAPAAPGHGPAHPAQ